MDPTPYQQFAASVAQRYGIPRDLFFGLIRAESNWNPRAVSSAGAIGLTQLMPGTARGLGVNPRDWRQNLEGGARYLAEQLKRFGDPRLALAAYNAGPGAVQRYGGVPPYRETQAYVQKIMGGLGNVGGAAPSAQPPAAASTSSAPQGADPRQAFLGGLQQAFQAQGSQRTALLRQAIMGMRQGLMSQVGQPLPQAQPAAGGGVGGLQGLRELFYDPRGGYDEGRFVPAIGGHGKHLHAAIDNPQAMLWLINYARQKGYSVRENPYVDPVDPVHTGGSFHYQTFPGSYGGRRLGRAVDISGGNLGALYDTILGRFGVRR